MEKNYNIREVSKLIRKVRICKDTYYYLSDVLKYFGYNKNWWNHHKEEIITDSSFKFIMHSCSHFGLNHKGLFINWYLLLRIITISAFQEITECKIVREAKTLSFCFGKIHKINLTEFVDFAKTKFRKNTPHYELIEIAREWLEKNGL